MHQWVRQAHWQVPRSLVEQEALLVFPGPFLPVVSAVTPAEIQNTVSVYSSSHFVSC